MAPWPVDKTARLLLGIAGNITAIGLWFAPMPTFIKIAKDKSVGDFSVLPYITTFLNCATWTFYGLPIVTDDNIPVSTINGIGFVFSTVFTLIFLANAKGKKRNQVLVLSICAVIFTTVQIGATLIFVKKSKREDVIGPFGVVFSTMLYVAPTEIVGLVIRTKSVEYMPFLLSLNGLVNATVWMTYGVYVMDIYVLIPNVLGVVFSIIQLVVYGMYRDCSPQTLPVSKDCSLANPSAVPAKKGGERHPKACGNTSRSEEDKDARASVPASA